MDRYTPLIFITIVEALIGIWVKLVNNSVPIFTLNFYRAFFALAFLSIVLPFIDKKFLKLKKSEIKPTLLMGFFIALQISLFNVAMSLAPIANVVVLWSVYPFFVFILSALFLNERVKKVHLFIFLFGLIGVIVANPLSLDKNTMTGNLISLFGGFVFGVLITYMRKQNKTKSPGATFWFFVFATLFLFPFLLMFGPGDFITPQAATLFGNVLMIPPIIWILALGMVSTGFAYLFMAFALKRINANIYSLIDIIASPLMATIFAFLILKEIPSRNMILGGAILLAAAFFLTSDLSEGRISRSHIFEGFFEKIRQLFKNSQ